MTHKSPRSAARQSAQAADRWAARALLVAGFFLGAFVGVLVAPDWQSSLEPFGVDQLSFRPAAPIILLCGVLGACFARDRGNPFERRL